MLIGLSVMTNNMFITPNIFQNRRPDGTVNFYGTSGDSQRLIYWKLRGRKFVSVVNNDISKQNQLCLMPTI